jgi:predicted transcriptional regulator of viral defense system
LQKLSFIDNFRKILLMPHQEDISIAEWINGLIAKGKHSFTLKEARNAFAKDSEAALKLKLNRLSRKGKIISIHKGYYLIIAPQYASKGMLPPSLFIDGLMKFMGKPYYVGLLNAAAFYGAAHQQPQEYYVFTNFPVLRPTKKKGIKINYISKKEFSKTLLQQRKTETGSITISSPELTAADLIQFDKRIGGLNRAVMVLKELTEEIQPNLIQEAFFEQVPVAVMQRLGFVCERILDKPELADFIFEESQKKNIHFFRVPLKTNAGTKGFPTDEKWKVIMNTQIEIEE